MENSNTAELGFLLEVYEMTEFKPFDAELREKYPAFKIASADPMFGRLEGLLMVKNGDTVQYISENGRHHGTFTVK